MDNLGSRAFLDWLEKNQFLTGGMTLMFFGGLLAYVRHLPTQIWGFVVRRCTISVEVPDRDPAFDWFKKWIAAHRYARRARDLSLTTVLSDPDDEPAEADDSAGGTASRATFILTPAPGTHVLTYRGRLLIFQRARRDLQNGGAFSFQETLSIQILGGSRALIDDLLQEAYQTSLPKVPGFNILSPRYDSWCVTSWRPKRPLGSIVLPDGMLESLLDDLRAFLASASWYADRGVPHRRGYLLYGPPGSGKTTLVAALAGELGLSVALLSLSSKLTTDETMRTLIDSLPAGTALLIEDVDCAFGANREAGDTGVTMSGLLNALDGVSSRQGRILFLTTNHPERLDLALIRPGRVDRSIHLGHTSRDQARRLFAWFYTAGKPDPEIDRLSRAFAARVPEGRISMAAIQEHLLRFRADPELAVEMLEDPSNPVGPVEGPLPGPLARARENGRVANEEACIGGTRG